MLALLSPSTLAGVDPDSLWFGGIDENGLAVQGGIWDFEDGTLQGWTSTDLTDEGDWFRHVTVDSCTAHAADGCPAITEGGSTGSMWAGAFEDEARTRCWPGGQGYDNRWDQILRRTFSYDGTGDVTLTFDYFVDTETQFDFAYVYTEVDGELSLPLNTSQWTTPDGWGYSGNVDQDSAIGSPSSPASETIVLDADVLPDGPGSFDLLFRVQADAVISDGRDRFREFLDTHHGAFGVDDVHLVGGGLDDLSDFEPTGIPGEELDGWVATSAPDIGTYLDVAPLADLEPPDVSGSCEQLQGTVMVAAVLDGSAYPHPYAQHEEFISNPLHVGPGSPAHASGLDRWLLRWGAYEDQPYQLAVSYVPSLHYYPWTCPETGVVGWTLDPAGEEEGYFADPARCITHTLDMSAFVPPDVDSVRVVIRLLVECDFFSWECLAPEQTNQSPYFDHIQIGLTEIIGVDDADGAPSVPGPGILGVHPNPVRTKTTLRYAIDARTRVRVDVLDVTGRVVTRLVDEPVDAGVHTVRWDVGAGDARSGDGGTVAPGVYWIRLRAGSELVETQRAVVTGP